MKLLRYYFVPFALAITCGAPFAMAQTASIISAFQQFRDVSAFSIPVPTVIDVPFDDQFIERAGFAVFDTSVNQFEPSYFMQSTTPILLSVSTDTDLNASAMADGNDATYIAFDVPGDRAVRSVIRLHSAMAMSASALAMELDSNVALPSSIAISALQSGVEKVVVADSPLTSTLVRFPQTNSSDWTITLTHVQPLRIAELRLVADTVSVGRQSLRFLAQPSHVYRIYFNPDRSISIPLGESGDLSGNRDIKRVAASATRNNTAYVQADTDGDGISDIRDNCVSTANADQEDIDGNGLGDVCQDFDRDGIPNVRDNCQDVPNVDQADTDGDGIGDVCDTEESRLTEKYKWIQWAGIGFAGLVIVSLFAVTVFAKREETSSV